MINKKVFPPIFLCIFFVFSFLLPPLTRAQVSTSSASEVDLIKDKIASQVAQISRAYKILTRGKVTQINSQEKSFTLKTSQKELKIRYLLETKYFWIKTDDSKLSLNFSNIEVDDELAIFGDYLKELEEINATTIVGKSFEKIFYAKIEDIAQNTVNIKTFSSETPFSFTLSPSQNVFVLKNNILSPESTESLAKNQKVLIRATYKDTKKNIISPKTIIIQN